MNEELDNNDEELSEKAKEIWELAQNLFIGMNNDHINLGVLFKESQEILGCSNWGFSRVIDEFVEKGLLKKYLMHCYRCRALIQDDGSDCPHCGAHSY